MNKEIFNQLSASEQLDAAQLSSAAERMQIPAAFQWELEKQLMEKYSANKQPARHWYTTFATSLAWGLAIIAGVLVLSWSIRSLIPSKNTNVGSPNNAVPFETNVREGNICAGPLAVAHNFSITVTNEDKTLLNTLDMENEGNELRSFRWSADGKQLAILANITGNGNILIAKMDQAPLQPLIPNSEAGYLMGFDWSRDGKQFVMWSLQNNTSVWLVNVDGTGLREVQLSNQIFGTPQFTPDGTSILYYGADSSSTGLFEVALDNSQTRVISPLVEDETGFAFSPDGKQLAYMEMDRTTGEARLAAKEFTTGSKSVLATLPIPKGSGSTIPDAANLSWSPNGDAVIFEFGISASDRVIYLAYADGSNLVKLAESAHAPAISADGNCLAYINDKQIFLIDLSAVSPTAVPPTSLLLADLPVGNSIAGFKLDILQWSP